MAAASYFISKSKKKTGIVNKLVVKKVEKWRQQKNIFTNEWQCSFFERKKINILVNSKAYALMASTETINY